MEYFLAVSTVGGSPSLLEARETKEGRKNVKKQQKNAKAKKEKKGKGKGKKVSSRSGAAVRPLTVQGLSRLSLDSPKGCYLLDLAHPSCTQLLKEFVKMRQEMNHASNKESFSILNVSLAGKAIGPTDNQMIELATDIATNDSNMLSLEIDAPAVDLNSVEKPIPSPVFNWVFGELRSKSATEAWKRQLVEAISKIYILNSDQVALVVIVSLLSSLNI